jgi:hypothetical protein
MLPREKQKQDQQSERLQSKGSVSGNYEHSRRKPGETQVGFMKTIAELETYNIDYESSRELDRSLWRVSASTTGD